MRQAPALAETVDTHMAFAEHGGALFGFALNALGDRAEAEDCIQEVFVRAWKTRARYTSAQGSVRTWLFAITRNLVVNSLRARARLPAPADSEKIERPGEPVTEDASIVERLALCESLATMTSEHREVIVAVQLEGLSFQGLSERTGVPVATLRTRMYYGLGSLRTALGVHDARQGRIDRRITGIGIMDGEEDTQTQTKPHPDEGRPTLHARESSRGEQRLASQLGDLARSLNQESPEAILQLVVAAAIELIPGVEEASLSVVTGRDEVETVAPSSELLRRLDDLQVELTEGPCLEAIYSERTIRVRDMATESRWPEFAGKATEAGVGSMLAFQLFVVGDNLGALNLYSSQVDAFDDDSEHVGLIVASHAAVALADAQQVSQLHEAVQSRDVIGQAKGVLMERYKITGHQAFLLLVKASQHTNKKLRALAEDLVNSGEFSNGTS